MALSEQRWNRVSESAFPWERDALEYLRTSLPDAETYRAWSNFTFIAGDGTINEVDALIVTPQGVFLIEIKSHPGVLTGDRGTWSFRSPEGQVKTIDNPLFLADRKAKRLKSLLLGSKALQNVYIEPLIFLSNPALSVQIPEADRISICQRDIGKTPGIIAAVKSRQALGLAPSPKHLIDRPFLRHLESAMQAAGIRPSQSLRRVGDYTLQDPLGEGPNGAWQDWSAAHVSIKKDIRRIRIYNYTRQPPADSLVVKAAATREYEILRSLDHSGILKATGYTEHERGPALVFSREPDEIRLDFYLNQYGTQLSLDRRLDFIRQIADALRYAHSRRIVHRALSPECVLVTQLESARPQLRIFNWQAGRELSSTSGATQRSSLTVDPRDYLEQSSAVYLAPEAVTNPQSRTEPMDLFSLGAIAYHILSNQRPAANLHELYALLEKHKGLPLPAVVDAPSERLQLLIRESTNPEVALRVASATEFLEFLTEAEDELTTPADSTIKNPLDARNGDRLPGGLVVKARLGSGGTAIAFLVEDEKSKRDFVLKLAIKSEHNDRIRDELGALKKLDHPFIVKPRSELLNIDGHTGFLMDRAGESTLAAYLRKDRLSLDLLGRFGEDLLDALTHLETMGIPHRDLKPDNIGVHKYGRNDEARLKLFDFSLSNLPLDQKQAGTPPYTEPFLLLKERKRWDPHADRFSAAQMLYEMATGTLPRWGDGQSAAHLIKDEASVESNLIDAPVRDNLTRFFTKALRRIPIERFESAEDMRSAWHNAFSDAKANESRPAEPVARQGAIATATLETPLMLLALGTRAENVLARENINTVTELLAVPLNRVLQMRGVGNKTRNEIVEAVRELRARFPEAPVNKPAPTKTTNVTENEATQTVDAIASRLTAVRTTKAKTEREVTLAFLDLAQPDTPSPAWPSQSDIARALHKERAQVSQIIVKARDRWSRDPAITKVRDLIADQLDVNSGLLETSEASSILLAAFGSDADGPKRHHDANAVLRAAVETERGLETPHFMDRRYEHATLILSANAAALIPWTDQLAQSARGLAHANPLPSPQRVLEALRQIGIPEGFTPPPEVRLVRLAATLAGVALSPRLELYPRDMPAGQALQLSASALAGAETFAIDEIRQRLTDRYPEAAPLPDRPDLDAILKTTGLDFTWDPTANLYRAPRQVATPSRSIHYLPTQYTPAWDEVKPEDRPAFDHARKLERTFKLSLRPGSWLVVTADPDLTLDAADRLTTRFGLTPFDLESAILTAMHELAVARHIDWNRVLAADADLPNGSHPERPRVEALLAQVIPALEKQLGSRTAPTLLLNPGLLARYHQMSLLDRLREANGPALWLLASGPQRQRPLVDETPVPVLSDAQCARVTPYWLTNNHRNQVHLHT